MYFWDTILKSTVSMNPTKNSAKKTGDAKKENLENKVFIWYNFCQEIRVKLDRVWIS